MAYPASPADQDLHAEGGKTHQWNAAGSAWIIVDTVSEPTVDKGPVVTSAALDALTGNPGDTATLTVDEGGRLAGIYVLGADGVTWSALAEAGLSDNLLGDAGAETSAARADHRHMQSRGPALPATTGAEGIEHVLDGHATLPAGKYVLIGTVWVQV